MDDRQWRRLDRQFQAMSRAFPFLGASITAIRRRPAIFVRLPLAVLLLLGGFLAFLPIFGLWMIPLGLLLLAVDLPLLRPTVSAAMIRTRRKLGKWRQKRGKSNVLRTPPNT